MAIGILGDTNIFLEILLKQDKKEDCKYFLQSTNKPLFISDFSLHSIGVILFRNGKQNVYTSFCKDLFQNVNIKSLPIDQYKELDKIRKQYQLDFDDAYQLLVAKSHDFKIATMDQDFKNTETELIHFI